MATVINTTPATRESDSAAAGWAVAVLVIVAALLVALFVWPGLVRQSAAPATVTPGANINVSLPTSGSDQTTPGTSGSNGGASSQPGGSSGGTQTTPQSSQTAPAN